MSDYAARKIRDRIEARAILAGPRIRVSREIPIRTLVHASVPVSAAPLRSAAPATNHTEGTHPMNDESDYLNTLDVLDDAIRYGLDPEAMLRAALPMPDDVIADAEAELVDARRVRRILGACGHTFDGVRGRYLCDACEVIN